MRINTMLGWTTVATIAVVGATPLPSFAQSDLVAPSGWSKGSAGGDVVFRNSSTGSELRVKRLQPLSGTTRDWFERQIELDGRSRGRMTSGGAAKEQKGMFSVVRSYSSARGAQSVAYMGYSVRNQGRLLVLSGSSAMALLQDVAVLGQVGQQVFDYDKKSGSGIRSTAGSSKTTVQRKTPVRTARTPVRASGNSKPLQAVKAKGTLKSSQILGVFLDESYNVGVGGMMVIQYDPILLLRDGSARRDLEIPPLDVNLAQDKTANRTDWGRWTRQGAKIKVKWSDGDTDELKASFKTRPAKPGETLKRGYSSIGGGGNTALGGDVMTFYSNSYLFGRDGSFSAKKSGGGGNSGATALSTSKNAGRYRLDGYTLTFRFNDGRVVRKLFYFYPDDNKSDVIGIGDDAYIGDD